jgi:hypothetical protein
MVLPLKQQFKSATQPTIFVLSIIFTMIFTLLIEKVGGSEKKVGLIFL